MLSSRSAGGCHEADSWWCTKLLPSLRLSLARSAASPLPSISLLAETPTPPRVERSCACSCACDCSCACESCSAVLSCDFSSRSRATSAAYSAAAAWYLAPPSLATRSRSTACCVSLCDMRSCSSHRRSCRATASTCPSNVRCASASETALALHSSLISAVRRLSARPRSSTDCSSRRSIAESIRHRARSHSDGQERSLPSRHSVSAARLSISCTR
mmetsp:Transcript_55108/g.126733  ORF Transcript_55108/g.126733 Transcript_55108/m.126733 type:complete len:216 (-) Transcript_55108:84-731(-)